MLAPTVRVSRVPDDPDEIDARFADDPLAVVGRVSEVLAAFPIFLSGLCLNGKRIPHNQRGVFHELQPTTDRCALWATILPLSTLFAD